MHVARYTRSALAILSLLGLATARPAVAQTYDAAADFSIASNPNGVWSYGYENTLGGALNLYTSTTALGASTRGWIFNISANTPVIDKNFGTTNDSFADVLLKPGQIRFHPGPQDQFSIIRWTAPAAGTYSLAASFFAVTTDGTTTDVHVLENNTGLFAGDVAGTYNNPTSSPSYSNTFLLNQGDTLDLAVGYGKNGSYFSDSTGFTEVIRNVTPSAVPEPSSLAFIGLGLLPLGVAARRRRAK